MPALPTFVRESPPQHYSPLTDNGNVANRAWCSGFHVIYLTFLTAQARRGPCWCLL
ncbi:hypothetical protein B566_EDAN016277, partial [Ephemera danica]